MSLKAGAIALGAGLAAFFGVGIGVTAVTEHWIDFPVLLGLLTGSIAGLAISAGSAVTLNDDATGGERRLAGTVVGFGVGFVTATVAAASLDAVGSVASIGVGFVGGVLVAVGSYKFTPTGSADSETPETQRQNTK